MCLVFDDLDNSEEYWSGILHNVSGPVEICLMLFVMIGL